MTVHVSLRAWNKGVDLVASTAFLTLVDKMAYGDRLLALQRLDSCAFDIETAAPKPASDAIKKFFSGQSSFYNRNKHNYLLECSWRGEMESDGTPISELHGRIRAAVHRRIAGASREFDSNSAPDRVILKDLSVYRTEVLVEDRDGSAKKALAQRLEAELVDASVAVSALGTCWNLALRAGSEEEATAVTDEIVVSRRRDRGLLLNPNDHRFDILSVERMETGQE